MRHHPVRRSQRFRERGLKRLTAVDAAPATARTAGVAVPVTPICWMVIEATRFPNAAACSCVSPHTIAEVIPAEQLSPAPTMSIGPETG